MALCKSKLITLADHTAARIIMHLYSPETMISVNNDNKFKQQKKTLEKLCGISRPTVIYKAAAAGGTFNIKPFNTI